MRRALLSRGGCVAGACATNSSSFWCAAALQHQARACGTSSRPSGGASGGADEGGEDDIFVFDDEAPLCATDFQRRDTREPLVWTAEKVSHALSQLSNIDEAFSGTPLQGEVHTETVQWEGLPLRKFTNWGLQEVGQEDADGVVELRLFPASGATGVRMTLTAVECESDSLPSGFDPSYEYAETTLAEFVRIAPNGTSPSLTAGPRNSYIIGVPPIVSVAASVFVAQRQVLYLVLLSFPATLGEDVAEVHQGLMTLGWMRHAGSEARAAAA